MPHAPGAVCYQLRSNMGTTTIRSFWGHKATALMSRDGRSAIGSGGHFPIIDEGKMSSPSAGHIP